MPWFKVDDGFHGHPKVVELSLSAVGLWTVAGSWCAKYLTDGRVPEKTVVRLGGDKGLATELIDAGLWLPNDSGYEFKDWADYQPLKETVEAERFAAQERMKVVRAAKKGVRDVFARTTSERSPEHPPNISRSSPDVRIAPSHPIPSQSHPKKDAPKRKPEIPLFDGWIPSELCKEYALANGIDVSHEADQFRAHAAANDRRQRDWDSAFRTWLGNAKKWSAPSGRRLTRTEENLAVVAQYAQHERLEIR